MIRNQKQLSRITALILWLLGSGSIASAQFYQGSQQTFGKNRVQYNDFLWSFYRFKNFDVYFYLGGQELAAYVGRTADEDIEHIEQLFDYKASGRLQFIIFNRLSDLKQSNIGLEDEQLETGNIGGITKTIGNKVLLYFDGSHEHLRQQVRGGASRVMMEQLMYGGNIKDRLQSAVLLNLPVWYIEGLSQYIATGWTIEDDNRMRDGILSGKYNRFNRMLDEDEIFAGQSMWNFIIEIYGNGSVANLLYMTRINRNIESGFQYVLGSPLRNLSQSWLDYYQRIYLNADNGRMPPSGKPIAAKSKKNRILSQAKISPDGTTIAYVTNDLGKYRVRLHDTRSEKSRKIMKGGYKSVEQKNDVSFPLLAWHPTGKILAVMREHKGFIWLDLYDITEKKWTRSKFFYFEKVISFSYSDDGNQIVLSGVQKGQSDIFIYNVRARTTQQITRDIFDDLNPRFILNSRYIVFSSNRTNDTLNRETKSGELPAISSTFDIFLYENSPSTSVLRRVTQTPDVNEMQPILLDSARFAYLSDESGIVNRYVATIDSVISFIDTTEHYRYIVNIIPNSNFSRNIEQHDLNFKKTRYAEIFYSNNRYQIYLRSNPGFDTSAMNPVPVKAKRAGKKFQSEVKKPQNTTKTEAQKELTGTAEEMQVPKDSAKIDISNYVFQTEFPKKKPEKEERKPEEIQRDTSLSVVILPTKPKDTLEYRLPRQRNYDPAFSADYFVAQLDNSMLNATYQAYTGGAVYFDPGLTGLFKIGISDMMNDYKITGGFRLAGDLNSNEYLLSFENLKRKVDKQIIFYRQAREFGAGFFFVKVHTHEFKYVNKFPFNDLASVRATVSYRNDRYVFKSTDIIALLLPNVYENWASAKAEFVYDNTLKTGLNLYNGIRLKLFAEGFRQVDKSKTFLGVAGFDIRHYQKIHRQIIWANRIAASTSFGDLKLIYYLGSQDNSIVPVDNFNFNINIDTSQNYAFQTLATPMRGFVQNIRNGNSFAVFNSEIRIPLFQYLFRRPIRSDLIRNFQVALFGDIGTAWTGLDPYSKDNSLNTQIIQGNPITIVLRKQIEPVVGGYGIGLRSRILGYFLKTDWAKGYEDGRWNKTIFYLTLGLDF